MLVRAEWMVRGPSVLMVVKKGRIRDGEKPRGNE